MPNIINIGADSKTVNDEIASIKQVRKITLSNSSWVDNKKRVNVDGIKATDTPLIALDLSAVTDVATKQTQKQEWGKIIDAQTRDGYIDFWCSEVPTVELKLIVKGV